MNNYTIYCTKEQTKKALELGAPIVLESEYYHPTENDFKLDKPIPCESFTMGYHYAKCPTAEQMCGWLDEVLPETCDIAIEYKIEKGKWVYFIGWRESEPIYNSRKEATIAAIDAALDYLEKGKNNENN